MKLKELMTENFSLIGESSSITEARSKLSFADYLVVTSNEGLPLKVITTSDLPITFQGRLTKCIAELPPTVIIGCDMDVSSMHDAPTGYLFKHKTRGAALLGKQGVVGIVPAKVIRSYLVKRPANDQLPSPFHWRRRLKEPLPKEFTIPITFKVAGKGGFGPSVMRFMDVAADVAVAGILGGNRVLATLPWKCAKCGWSDVYVYVSPTIDCKNPDPTVEPQPWPHTLA